ncbi:MAG TPA: dihydrolipoamide acetyltransferase family protein [Tenuifilaceae bacterium]|nr:dihydrolipoamide acetyltransferase family protein [Tenuifilaceae bacterium]HPS03971.1 dihydrolipoamide acetyltransferase family protein [Tenuifilaceae bacterium]
MRYIFNFPDIGEGLDEGTIAEWYVQKGQHVEAGDPLVNMETDKVVTDIPSPKSGTIVATYGKIGETIRVGSPLVEIDIEGVEGEAAVAEVRKEEPVEEGAGVVGTLEVAGNSAFLPAGDEGFEQQPAADSKIGRKALATPVARAMAKELGIDINRVTGTGPSGRVTTQDIENFLKKGGTQKSLSVEPSATMVASGEQLVEYEPLTQIRKTIARNMIQSKQNAAHMSVFDEVEVSELVRIRAKYKDAFAEKGVKLSYLPFILKALAVALSHHKTLNSQLDLENNRIIYKKYFNIGIAVDTEEGLVVPVIRGVDKLSVFEIAERVNEIAEKARNRKLTLDDMKDGTFTVTNYGSIGGQFAVPVINYPQVGILGIGRLVEKPVISHGELAKGMVLPLSLSVDHRIVDGGEVARFLNRLIAYLADPVSLIME